MTDTATATAAATVDVAATAAATVEAYFAAWNETDPARRRAFVEAACGDDSALNAEVGQFLRLADSDAHTLERTQVAQQVRDALAQGLGPDGADKPEVAWIGRRLGAWEIVAEIDSRIRRYPGVYWSSALRVFLSSCLCERISE